MRLIAAVSESRENGGQRICLCSLRRFERALSKKGRSKNGSVEQSGSKEILGGKEEKEVGNREKGLRL